MVQFDGENRRAAQGDWRRDRLSEHTEVHISRPSRQVYFLQHLSDWKLYTVSYFEPKSALHMLGGVLYATYFHLDHRRALYLLHKADET